MVLQPPGIASVVPQSSHPLTVQVLFYELYEQLTMLNILDVIQMPLINKSKSNYPLVLLSEIYAGFQCNFIFNGFLMRRLP